MRVNVIHWYKMWFVKVSYTKVCSLTLLNTSCNTCKTQNLCSPPRCHQKGCFRVESSWIFRNGLMQFCCCGHLTQDIQIIVTCSTVCTKCYFHSCLQHPDPRSNP